MEIIVILLGAYALTFFLQQKAFFLRGRISLVDKLLDCTFCLAFHTGWIVALLTKTNLIFQKSVIFSDMIVEILVLALSSASFSYFLDTLIRWMESQIDYGD